MRSMMLGGLSMVVVTLLASQPAAAAEISPSNAEITWTVKLLLDGDKQKGVKPADASVWMAKDNGGR